MTAFTAYMPFLHSDRHFNSTLITPPSPELLQLERIEPGVTVQTDEPWCLVNLKPGPHGAYRGSQLTRQDRTVWFNQDNGFIWDEEDEVWLGARWSGDYCTWMSDAAVEATGTKCTRRSKSARCYLRN